MTGTGWGLPDPEFQPEFYADTATKRAIAWVIDTVLIGLICALVVLLTAFTALFFLFFVYSAVNFVYRWVALTRYSATPGMLLLAVEFRDRTGQRLDGLTAFLHTAGYAISTTMVLPQILSIGLMLTTPRGQGLTDLVLGTAAINRPAMQ